MVLDSCEFGDEVSVKGKVQAKYYGEIGKKLQYFIDWQQMQIYGIRTHFRYHSTDTVAKTIDMAREMMMFLCSVPQRLDKTRALCCTAHQHY